MKRILLASVLTVLAFTSCKKESVDCVKIKDIQPIYIQWCAVCGTSLYSYQVNYDDGTSKEVSIQDVQNYSVGNCK